MIIGTRLAIRGRLTTFGPSCVRVKGRNTEKEEIADEIRPRAADLWRAWPQRVCLRGLFIAKSDHRIDFHGAAGGDVRGNKSRGG